jgi:C1A family cysteine protease
MVAGKVVALLSVVALSLVAFNQLTTSAPSNELRTLWASWKTQYGKSYTTQQEDDARFAIFTDNIARINAWNAQSTSSWQALNKFGDLTGDEFKTTYASCAGGISEGVNDEYCPSATNCPELTNTPAASVNWTQTGAVTAVKNQQQCGSCWAFSTTGSLEGLYWLNHSLLISFSEQQLVDCAKQCEACDGCWPYLAMEYTATSGIEPEKLYPYKGVQGNCQYKAALSVKANTGYQCVTQKSLAQMQSAATLQPTSIAVEADQNAWQFYAGGVVTDQCGDALDHAVLIAGYGPYNGGDVAWYVKNSWGADWGESGYIWIGTDATQNQGFGVCGILRCGTLPINA